MKLVIAQEYCPMLAIRLLGTACLESPCRSTVTTKDTINVENIKSCLLRQQLFDETTFIKKHKETNFAL